MTSVVEVAFAGVRVQDMDNKRLPVSDPALLEAAGAADDAAVTNPASSGSVVALLKGVLSYLSGFLSVKGYGFDVLDAPSVTAGPYSAGDVMGGYREIEVARANDEPVLIIGVQIACKANVTPNVRIVIFGAAPDATLADNAVYTLSTANVLCVRKTLSSVLLGASWSSHGATVKSLSLSPVPFVMKPIAATKKIGYYLIDDTGVTLASTSDIQVRFSGVGV
jgi:hypothetical protein